VSVIIRYRHRERPDEAGMTMIANQADAQAMAKRLEWQGYLVEKVTAAQSTSARAAAEPLLDWPLSNPDPPR
jgi:hypothetical protein